MKAIKIKEFIEKLSPGWGAEEGLRFGDPQA